MGILDNHKHWASSLHRRGKPRQGREDSSANLFRFRWPGAPPRICRKTQQHGERFNHISPVQIEVAEKVSEALAPRDVIVFASKTQRPLQLLDRRPKRAGLMLRRTIEDNLGVRRFAKLHAKRLQQAGFADAGFSLQQDGLAFAFHRFLPPPGEKAEFGLAADERGQELSASRLKRLGAVLGRSTR